ncbi:MAG: hemolysin family protein [Actinomycetota bacterium]
MTLWYLAIAVLLLLLNGFFVGAEFALIAARRSKIEEMADGGNARARAALRSLRELSFMLAGAQLGITMASLGLGAIAEPAVARLLEAPLDAAGLPEAALHSVAFVIALAIVVFLHMVVGEMAPKNIAIAEPEKSALWLAAPFRLFTNIFRPFILLLNALANGTLRLLRVEPVDELHNVHTSEELGLMISEAAKGGTIDLFEHRLLSGAIALSERDAASVMVPRTDLVAVPVEVPPGDIERLVLETGHSRFPVYVKDIDTVIGFFHAKDLLKISEADRDKPLKREFIRKMLVVPESRDLHPLLFDMKRQRQHFALVLDEHGGTAGIVTLEDVLEELVGEIRDEYDMLELGIEKVGEGRWLIPGTMHVDEAESRLGLDLPEGEYETVAGFVMDRLGRIPQRRDVVQYDGWLIRVMTMHRRRVVQVMLEKTGAAQPPE